VADTRQRLIDGVIETIRLHGLTGTTARSIAATAGVNQALVFYHFGTVHDLLQAACLAATQARVELFAERLDQITDLRQLLVLGRALHSEERAQGNVMMMGLSSASQHRSRVRRGRGCCTAGRRARR
jgi:AcrR family transcriptional regulator